FLALGFWPTKADFIGDEKTAGVGPAGGGLRRGFPSMIFPTDNPIPASAQDERVKLGQTLFFDPILSGANDISCATCHHPDLGFSDGRGLSMGKGGKGLGPDRAGGSVVKRGAPSLWNAAFNHMQFWDGRAPNLEEQARGPITSDIEMNENPDNLVKELKEIPEYVKLFDAAFNGQNGSAVTFDNVLKAVASFERTLISNNSPFDRYAAGDINALTAEQKRGFNLFRSGKTRCFECHGLPTFANPDFKILGVPPVEGQEADLGRFDVTQGEGNKHAFKVPTLRNVVLNAPYMHNGRFKALEEVIDFYAGGGGLGAGFNVPHIDDKIRIYTISPQEKSDLIAFLYSLADESKLPAIPDKVPSGLAVVAHINNPARDLVAKHNTGAARETVAERPPQTLTVKQGESIQSAVDRARPGDTIEVMPGLYHEEIHIDLNRITLRGLKGADGQRAVLDGKKELADAIVASGDDFTLEGFEIRHYIANGAQAQNARNCTFRDLVIDDTGLYGTYPVSCSGVTIEKVVVSRIADAAIYVGQSRDIVVRDSEAHHSVTGIEIENSVNAVVENNYCHDNTGGILVFILPNNPSKVGWNCKVVGNRVIDNNHPNFGNPNSIVSRVPPGGGILIMAADDNEVTGNEIRGNNSYGVSVISLDSSFPAGTQYDVGAVPERNWIHDNHYSDNGRQPAESITARGLKGGDLIWDLSGSSNRWDEPNAVRAVPVLNGSWPEFARRAYWRVLRYMAGA
ncbi:MAG TPA: parallel beta-helix domain-containing protein, partial [Blastocatellia bacterium]